MVPERGHEGRRDDLRSDPMRLESDDEDEVWFEPAALAAASSVVLGEPVQAVEPGRSASLLPAPSSTDLVEGLASPGLCLSRLPGWPEAPSSGAGLGSHFAALLGELRPGDVVVWTGRGRGAGRTSLLAQLADGLALRDQIGAERAPARPPSPVVWIGDQRADAIRARSLARYSGLALSTFLDPGHARRHGGASGLASVVEAYEREGWTGLAARQRFIASDDAGLFGDAEPDWLEDLGRWRASLGEQLEVEGAGVWPVLILDPLESLLGPERAPDEAARSLANLAERAESIVFASCDAFEDPSSTRAFDRHVHARVRLTPIAAAPGANPRLGLELCHGRLGQLGRVELEWWPKSGRLVASDDGTDGAC